MIFEVIRQVHGERRHHIAAMDMAHITTEVRNA